MFICSPCLEENYTNWSFFKSRGKCELCEKESVCHDIPSKDLCRKLSRTKSGEIVKNLF